ncbi:hypothetical protein [Hymenobacter profundi]|uniref:LPS export ABC transporter periplasmic protein LptC n=1 Tax=Hymenobacter profundi TaxID=1982110 RepID=A0ABS6X1M3_9BACT|nr:hypothetical protein [Hymenobacter profundi]MBW3129729.1 hypothetical protein [Hymenobacter profundi]
MRNIFIFLIGAGLWAGATGCGSSAEADSPASATTVRPAYFPLKEYLDAQATRLNQQQPPVEKRVTLRGSAPETTRVPKIEWDKELQVFYQADINKPALRGAYAVDSTTLPNGTRQILYTRKPGFDNAVVRLTVVRDASGVRSVDATLQKNNPLFYSEKKLQLRGQAGTLDAYQVQGVQKLVLFDTLRYATNARVVR